MISLLRDVRYSVRSFARTPGPSLVLVLTIALGIGANAAVSGFVAGLVAPPSALGSLRGVVSVYSQGAHGESVAISGRDYLALQRCKAFEWVGAARIFPATVRFADHTEIVPVAATTPHLAAFLGLELDGGVAMSQRIWQGQYRAKADIRGEEVRIDGVDGRVGSVAPGWLEGLYRDRAVDFWTPLREAADSAQPGFWALAKLRSGVSAGQAQARLAPGSGDLRVLPYTGMTPEMAQGVSRVGLLLSFAATLVFFIACGNAAAFLLGRAFARSRDTSLRVALGASRGQLARRLLADTIVISVAGTAAGLFLGAWTAHVLPALLFEQDAGHLIFAPDLRRILLASAACLAITIVSGLLPIGIIPYDRPAAVLRQESAGPSPRVRRLRMLLVVAQMAGCSVLVISASVLLAGFRNALQTSAGRGLGEAILATVQVHPDVNVDIRYFLDVEHAAQALAGVIGTAWSGRAPGGEPAWQSFRIDPQMPLRTVTMDLAWFTPDALALFTLPPVAGRLFEFGDNDCRVAVVNEEAAGELFGKESVGRTVHDFAGLSSEIVGIVARKPSAGAMRPTIYYHGDAPGERLAGVAFRAPAAGKLAAAELDANVVSPAYFSAMGLPLRAGRLFADGRAAGACRVAVVNQEAADLYFGGSAVGAAVIDVAGRRTAISGVVQSAPPGIFQRRAEPAIYFPMAQDCLRTMTLILGARRADRAMLADLRGAIEAVPGRGPAPAMVTTLQERLGQTALAPLRIATLILGACAAIGLLLNVLGLYGALSEIARQRRRELAVRVAFGARRRHIAGRVLAEGARLAAAGAIAGTLASLVLLRFLNSLAPAAGPPALWVWLAAPLALSVAIAVASVLPVRGALLVNPHSIMRIDN